MRSRMEKDQCPFCGTHMRVNVLFCPACGLPVAQQCTACSASTGVFDRFCSRCGQRLPAHDIDSSSIHQSPAAGSL